jgi:2-phosphoglycerate kinase
MNTIYSKYTEQLSHIFWIGGSNCCGKSTISELLAKRYGLDVYHCDEHTFGDHFDRVNREKQPELFEMYHKFRFEFENFLTKSDEDVLMFMEKFLIMAFRMVIDDLLVLPRGKPVIVEGPVIQPQVLSNLGEHKKMIWYIPSEEFLRNNHPTRDFVIEQAKSYKTPEKTIQNWVHKSAYFARRQKESAKQSGLRFLDVDGSSSIEEIARLTETHFQLAQPMA